MRRRPLPLLAVCIALAALVGAGCAPQAAIEVAGARLVPLPSRVMSRPFVLRPGDHLERDGLLDHLAHLGWRRVAGPDVALGEWSRAERRLVLGRRGFRHADGAEPGARFLVRLARTGRVAALEDDRGRRLATLALPPLELHVFLAPGGVDRRPVDPDGLPPALVSAVLAVEDRRFHQHAGLDWRRVAGALRANLRAGHIVEGASTLTQQLAKNLYLSRERTWLRKLREARLALALERRFDKRTLLAAYLDAVYLGQHGGVAIHGVERAALHHFGRPLAELGVAEYALLAGMLRGPSLYDPRRRPAAARARRDRVLEMLAESGELTAAELASARTRPLAVSAPPAPFASAGWFAEFVAAPLRARYGARRLASEGLAVHTTLDPRLQAHAERAVTRGLARLERGRPALVRPEAPLQAALVALDPRRGEVLAMVGGRDFARAPWNRAVHARRQPGSAFKPVVALAALERGGRLLPRFTLATTLEDRAPGEVEERESWWPANHDGSYLGEVTLRDALEQSRNAPFARLGDEIGPRRIAQTARRLGIESRMRAVPSLALGTSEVTLLELTRAYAVLAAGGRRPALRAVRSVADVAGRELERIEPRAVRAFARDEAWLITSALRGAVERGTGASLRRLGYRGPAAGKTGTTDDYRDAWFVAYTPELVVGVWVGFDDGTSLHQPGARAALPVAADFLAAAFGSRPSADFIPPSEIEEVRVVAEAGRSAGLRCGAEEARSEVFLRGSAPEERCDHDLWLAGDRNGRIPRGRGRWRFGRPPPGERGWPFFLRLPFGR